jgi:hypothetical protein
MQDEIKSESVLVSACVVIHIFSYIFTKSKYSYSLTKKSIIETEFILYWFSPTIFIGKKI